MPSIGDLLFAFTEWLRTTQLTEFSLWISNTPLSIWIGGHFWAIPIIQTLHILAIAAAFGSVLMINMRILGITGGGSTVAATAARYLPWIWVALAVLIVTGIGMIVGEPVRELINPIFWMKMAAIVLMVLLSVWFQARVRHLAGSNPGSEARAGVRIGAVAIIVLWCVIIVCGRWIAYAPV